MVYKMANTVKPPIPGQNNIDDFFFYNYFRYILIFYKNKIHTITETMIPNINNKANPLTRVDQLNVEFFQS